MPLIQCPECGKQISDAADICPSCGYPIRKRSVSIRNFSPLRKPDSMTGMCKAWIVLAAFGFIAGLFCLLIAPWAAPIQFIVGTISAVLAYSHYHNTLIGECPYCSGVLSVLKNHGMLYCKHCHCKVIVKNDHFETTT